MMRTSIEIVATIIFITICNGAVINNNNNIYNNVTQVAKNQPKHLVRIYITYMADSYSCTGIVIHKNYILGIWPHCLDKINKEHVAATYAWNGRFINFDEAIQLANLPLGLIKISKSSKDFPVEPIKLRQYGEQIKAGQTVQAYAFKKYNVRNKINVETMSSDETNEQFPGCPEYSLGAKVKGNKCPEFLDSGTAIIHKNVMGKKDLVAIVVFGKKDDKLIDTCYLIGLQPCHQEVADKIKDVTGGVVQCIKKKK